MIPNHKKSKQKWESLTSLSSLRSHKTDNSKTSKQSSRQNSSDNCSDNEVINKVWN